MAPANLKTVKVLATTGNKAFPTYNIKTAGSNQLPTLKQIAKATKMFPGENMTCQDSGGQFKGLKTVIIPGYVKGL